MRQFIGVFINGTPYMPELAPGEDKNFDHVVVGLTHSGQGWYADPKDESNARLMEEHVEIKLEGEVHVRTFSDRRDRVAWLQSLTRDQTLEDPHINGDEPQTAQGHTFNQLNIAAQA